MKRLLAGLLLASCLPALAEDRAAGTQLAVDLQKLDSDAAMMLYDDSDPTPKVTLKKHLEALEAPLQAFIDALPPEDREAATASRETMLRALLGGDGAQGLVNSGFDGQGFAEYRTGIHDLLAIVTPRGQVDGNTPEDAARLMAARIVSVYVRTAALPFGSYSDTNDASTDEDLVAMAKEMDALVAAVAKRHAGDAAHAATVRRIVTKWRFLRGTIVRYTQQSTPTIVYRHGTDIIDALASLR